MIVRAPGDAALVRRVEAELGGNWRVVQAREGDGLGRSLSELGREQSASAALRYDTGRAELELWVADVEGSADGRTERLSAGSSGESVLALRVVESLRARMLARARVKTPRELAPEAAPPRPLEQAPEAEPAAGADAQPQAAPPEAERELAEPAARVDEASEAAAASRYERSYPALWLELAPAVSYSPGDLGPAFDAWTGVRLQPAALWSLALFALVPIWSESLRAPEGSASVSTWLLGGGAFVSFAWSALELDVGAGLGGVLAFTSGEARAPYSGTEDTAFVPAALAGPALRLRLGRGAGVYARAFAGATIPTLEVRFGTREVASWGAPFVLGALGFELALTGS